MLKIIFHPHVMIANKKMNFYSLISDLGKFAQQSYKPLRDHFPVFIPKIKNIAHDKDLCSILFYFIQELNDKLFPLKTFFMIGSAEMEIRKKINFFIDGQLHLSYSFVGGTGSNHLIRSRACL